MWAVALQGLAIVGSAASIVSLVLTWLVYVRLKSVENRFLATARIPELSERLSRHGTALAGYLQRFSDSSDQIAEELSRATVIIRYMASLLPREAKESANDVYRLLREANAQQPTEKQVRDIYAGITMGVEEATNYQETTKWIK